jgi:hypothetical protein
VAGKSIQSQEETERCLTKPDGKAATSSWGARMGIVWTPFRALAPAKKMIMRWNPSMVI